MDRTAIEGIDLNDPERFVRLEHHEMFTKLRAESPVYWQEDDLKGGGYWNVVKHADLIEVNRDTATFSSELGSTQIMSGQYPIGEDPDMPFDTRGVLMLDMDPPKHTRYRLLVNKGFTPRMIGLIEQALRHRATVIVDNVIETGSADFVENIAAEHGCAPGGPAQAVRLDQPHGRRRRPRVHGQRPADRVRRALRLRERARRAPP
jgi:cholest-4-en-3-one 26-monooxygenase